MAGTVWGVARDRAGSLDEWQGEVILKEGGDHRLTPSQPTPTGLSFGEKGTISSVA